MLDYVVLFLSVPGALVVKEGKSGVQLAATGQGLDVYTDNLCVAEQWHSNKSQ